MKNASHTNPACRHFTWKVGLIASLVFLCQSLMGHAGSLADFNQILPQGSTEVTVQQQSDSALILTYTTGGFQLIPVAIQKSKTT